MNHIYKLELLNYSDIYVELSHINSRMSIYFGDSNFSFYKIVENLEFSELYSISSFLADKLSNSRILKSLCLNIDFSLNNFKNCPKNLVRLRILHNVDLNYNYIKNVEKLEIDNLYMDSLDFLDYKNNITTLTINNIRLNKNSVVNSNNVNDIYLVIIKLLKHVNIKKLNFGF